MSSRFKQVVCGVVASPKLSVTLLPNTVIGSTSYGARGPAGVGIENVSLAPDNSFIITLTDGTTITTTPVHITGEATDYATLANLPKINGVVIKDNYDFAHYNLNALSNIEIDKILT